MDKATAKMETFVSAVLILNNSDINSFEVNLKGLQRFGNSNYAIRLSP